MLFEQNFEANERANHVDILQKWILGAGHIKCKDLEVRAEGKEQEEAGVARPEWMGAGTVGMSSERQQAEHFLDHV